MGRQGIVAGNGVVPQPLLPTGEGAHILGMQPGGNGHRAPGAVTGLHPQSEAIVESYASLVMPVLMVLNVSLMAAIALLLSRKRSHAAKRSS